MHCKSEKKKNKYALLVPLDSKAVSFSFGPNAIPSGLNCLAYFETVLPHVMTKERIKAYLQSSICCQFISLHPYSVELSQGDFWLLQRFGLKKGLKFLEKKTLTRVHSGQFNCALNCLLSYWVTIQHPALLLIRELVMGSNIGILFVLNQFRRKDLVDKVRHLYMTFTSGVRVNIADNMFSDSI